MLFRDVFAKKKEDFKRWGTLKNDLLSFYIQVYSIHHPASLYKVGSICDEDVLRYSFNTEEQPGSHRLADFWHFASKINTRLLFYYSRLKV